MRSPTTFCSTLLLAAALVGCEPHALPTASDGVFVEKAYGGTSGRAIPTGVFSDDTGQYVGHVTVDITGGWLSAPHAVRVSVTSDNLVVGEPHGEGVFPLADLEVNGLPQQGVAEVIIPWVSATGDPLDENITSPEHIYDACASVIFADHHESPTVCTGNYVFSTAG